MLQEEKNSKEMKGTEVIEILYMLNILVKYYFTVASN